jgi:lysyl-tRNA synthetase class 2
MTDSIKHFGFDISGKTEEEELYDATKGMGIEVEING